MLEEAINTSAIEGENLNREEVKSSVARFLGIDLTKNKGFFPKEDGIYAMLLDVRESIKSDVSKKMLCKWHKTMLYGSENYKKTVLKGQYRDAYTEIIKDDIYGNVDVIFKAPGVTREEVTEQMNEFLAWYNASSPLNNSDIDMPGPARAAIAHLWFVSIHPFEDGNGRIARAIAEHALFQDFDSPPLFSISTAINDGRDDYYKELASTNESMDVSNWVNWFVKKVSHSQDLAIKKVDFILKKAKFWDKYGNVKLNERQQKVLDKIFGSGLDGFIKVGISNEKYRAITGNNSNTTTTRDLKDLVEKSIFYVSGTGRRNLRYNINLVEDNAVFKIKHSGKVSNEGNREKFIQATLEKMLVIIQRNLDFHQDINNPKLLSLIENYKELAEGEEEYFDKLEKIISSNNDGLAM
jgi:Fic family protein